VIYARQQPAAGGGGYARLPGHMNVDEAKCAAHPASPADHACPSTPRAALRTNPCACTAGTNPQVPFCDAGHSFIARLNLLNASGVLPGSAVAFANLTEFIAPAAGKRGLTGALPAALFEAWPELVTLDVRGGLAVGGNHLTGPLPALPPLTSNNLTKLRNLRLWGNAFEGPLPAALPWAKLTTCDVLDRENRFSCPLPAALLANAKCVTSLPTGGTPRRATSSDCFVPPAGPTPCTGWSAQLLPGQCGAWISLFDKLGGEGWGGLKCPLASPRVDPRTNPCLCRGTANKDVCNGTAIVDIDIVLSANVSGSLPDEMAALTRLTRLVIAPGAGAPPSGGASCPAASPYPYDANCARASYCCATANTYNSVCAAGLKDS